MNRSDYDLGVITVLLERLEKQRLPRVLAIKQKVDNGDCLDDVDIEFFKAAFADAQNILPQVHQHPEYQELVGKIVQLYHDVIEKATDNQVHGNSVNPPV